MHDGGGTHVEKLTILNKRVDLFRGESADAPLVVLNGEDGEGAAMRDAIRSQTDADFALAAIGGLDWDLELTPWPAKGIRRGQDFGGQAGEWLSALTGEVLPRVLAKLGAKPRWTGLAGYSLAGLFALWTLYQSDVFDRVASGSGSLWYPEFEAYAAANAFRRPPERLYLSLGDREALTKNPVMQPVEAVTRRLAERWSGESLAMRFEINPGGHFNDPVGRMARGIAWLLQG